MILSDLEPLVVSTDRLKLMEGNPRRGDVEAVARSLDQFGQRKPVVARTDGTVIAGNHTLQAALSLGWEGIAVVWVDEDDATAQAYALADNRTAELGGYDDGALAALIASVQEADVDLLEATGWSDNDLQELLDKLAEPEQPPDPGNVPAPPTPKSVSGDVWILGDHRVMCGDSTSPTDLETLLAGGLAELVWTDPPYGVSYVGKTADALTIYNDGEDEFEAVLDGAFDSVLSACEPGSPVYVAAPAGPAGIPFAVKLLERGLFRQRLVWVKDSLVLGHSDYHYRHEDLYLGYTPGGSGRRGRGGDNWFGGNAQTSVLEFPRPKANVDHPTMKPVELISYCILNSSRRNAVVLDLFGGSGSTLVAAETHGRRARVMELDPRYVDVICRRWQQQTGNLPFAEASGRPHDFDT